MVHVAIRVGGNAGAGDLDDLFAGAKGQRFLGTAFHAAGEFALGKTRCAQGAFHDSGSQRLAVFVCRDFERAGYHAVAAADADGRVIADGTVRLFLESPDKTGRRTSGFQAVVALLLDEDRCSLALELVDDGIGLFIGSTLGVQDSQVVELLVGCRQSVDFVAGQLAFAAANAAGCVKEHAHGVGMRAEGFASCLYRRGKRNARACGAQQSEECST